MKAHNSYKLLGIILNNLGYLSYENYLKSKKWLGIREKVLERDGYLCRMCGLGRAVSAHHIGYTFRSMSGRDIRTIVSVCGVCHKHAHFGDDGQKRSFLECIEVSQMSLIYTPPGFDVNPNQADFDLLHGRIKQKRSSKKNIKRQRKKLKASNKRRDEKLREAKWSKALKRMVSSG